MVVIGQKLDLISEVSGPSLNDSVVNECFPQALQKNGFCDLNADGIAQAAAGTQP